MVRHYSGVNILAGIPYFFPTSLPYFFPFFMLIESSSYISLVFGYYALLAKIFTLGPSNPSSEGYPSNSLPSVVFWWKRGGDFLSGDGTAKWEGIYATASVNYFLNLFLAVCPSPSRLHFVPYILNSTNFGEIPEWMNNRYEKNEWKTDLQWPFFWKQVLWNRFWCKYCCKSHFSVVSR